MKITCNTHCATICDVSIGGACRSVVPAQPADVDYGRRSSPRLITRIRIYRATYARASAPLVNEKRRRRPGAVILIHADARRGRFSSPTVLIILQRDIVRLLLRHWIPWILGTFMRKAFIARHADLVYLSDALVPSCADTSLGLGFNFVHIGAVYFCFRSPFFLRQAGARGNVTKVLFAPASRQCGNP